MPYIILSVKKQPPFQPRLSAAKEHNAFINQAKNCRSCPILRKSRRGGLVGTSGKTQNSIAIPSPVLAFVGRKNSGKTTLLEKLIAELAHRGIDVATCKHHGHPDFEIDIPGKDSYRHRAAGASAVVVMSDIRLGFVEELGKPKSCADALALLPNHDIVLVEGFRDEGLPYVEIMRAANERDRAFAPSFCQKILKADWQADKEGAAASVALRNRSGSAVAAVSDIPEVIQACEQAKLPCFDPNDIVNLANYVEQKHVRPKLTVAIQAGGESRRMGQSKALVPFLGRPLVERIVERVEPIADEVLITTNEPERLEFLLAEHPLVRLVTDEYDRRGALPGLITALANAKHPQTAITACDMVNVSPELLAAESSLMRNGGFQVVMPRTSHGVEPFAAVYETESCLVAAREAFESGESKMRSVIERLNTLEVDKSNPGSVPFPLGCFLNVNTPDELELAGRIVSD